MNRKISPIFLTAILALVFVVGAGAQTPTKPASLPNASDIINKYVQAIGGAENIKKTTSRISKATIEIAGVGLNGTAEVFEKAPNKTATFVNITNFGLVQEGFDGTAGWSQDPQTGLRDKTGKELAAAKLDSEFFKAIKMNELYPKIVVKGTEKVGEKDAYVLEATPVESSIETWYFDTQSGLLVRQDSEREGPQGKQMVQTYMENYKKFDGLSLPTTIRQVTPAFTINISIQEVKHNVPIDDAKFKKPAVQQ